METKNKELVIDVSSSDVLIALLENRQLVELNKDKTNLQYAVGDIYLGRVKKIMPGLNAAFVNVGYEKDAFLHYLDLGPQFKSLCKLVKYAKSTRHNFSLNNFEPEEDIKKDGKINDVLTTGQDILVQIAKEPISTKGPRLSSEMSIAGRNLVLIPFSDKISVSQKITSSEERSRLRSLIQSITPKNYGVIVRTVAEGKRVAELDHELRELINSWESAFANLHKLKPTSRVIGELNRASAILRDILNNTFNSITVNDEIVFREIKDYIKTIAPDKEKIVKFHSGGGSVFDKYDINKQIKSLFGRTVALKTGAYLIIEHTEALHVIDVNSGNRSKSEMDQESNAVEVNISAAEEIARQLRLRDMGGIIVIDFIDMQSYENKKLLYQTMKELMSTDRAKHHILPLSKFGILQITRQRVRPEMNIESNEKCPSCRGTGNVSPTITITEELEKKLAYISEKITYKEIVIKLHPYVHAYLTKGFFSTRRKWSKQYKKKISFIADSSIALNDYNFFNKNNEEIFI